MSRQGSVRAAAMWLLVVALVVAVPVLRHCTGPQRQPAKSPSSGRSTQETITPPGTVVPGIRKIEYGRVQAAGTVRYIDLEGGFWALTKPTDDPASSKAEDIVVVVVNAEEVGLPALEGQDVAVDGKLIEGASIRMAGPEMTAEEVIRPH